LLNLDLYGIIMLLRKKSTLGLENKIDFFDLK
jgi:hypothetical protein